MPVFFLLFLLDWRLDQEYVGIIVKPTSTQYCNEIYDEMERQAHEWEDRYAYSHHLLTLIHTPTCMRAILLIWFYSARIIPRPLPRHISPPDSNSASPHVRRKTPTIVRTLTRSDTRPSRGSSSRCPYRVSRRCSSSAGINVRSLRFRPPLKRYGLCWLSSRLRASR